MAATRNISSKVLEEGWILAIQEVILAGLGD